MNTMNLPYMCLEQGNYPFYWLNILRLDADPLEKRVDTKSLVHKFRQIKTKNLSSDISMVKRPTSSRCDGPKGVLGVREVEL